MRIIQLPVKLFILMLATQAHCMENMHGLLHRAHDDMAALADLISPTLGRLIDGQEPAITNNPHKDEVAFVKQNSGIHYGEKEFLNKRLPVVKAALEKMLQRSLQDNQVPKIAIIGSGGGYRAMFCTTGSLCGAEKIGLLDATTYITSLSGSTWAIAPWISTGMPIKKFKHYIQECASTPFHRLTHGEKLLIARVAAVKETYNQPRTLVDFYGDLLGNRLLACMEDDRHMIYLSHQTEKIKDGSYPYPIYTAIDGREEIVDNQIWYEFTPHAIGNRTNNMFVPSWAYGRKFKKGVSTNDAPEKPLGYHMGTWGSAFAASIDDIVDEVTSSETEDKSSEFFEKIKGKRVLPFWAEIPNYMYKMNDTNDIPLSQCKHMKFVDAGLNANLPYPPVSGICPERKADILIFLDASAGELGGELKKSADYAQRHNLPFPAINLDNLNTKTITIFKDETNRSTPVVIYMPRISDKDLWEANKLQPQFKKYKLSNFDLDYETNNGYCSTKHFHYTPEHSTLVMHQTEFNMRVNRDTITEVINWIIDRK